MKERKDSTIVLHDWAESVMFASGFTNELLGYIPANEVNSASKCSWDWKLIVSTLKFTLMWHCPGQQGLSSTICGAVWGGSAWTIPRRKFGCGHLVPETKRAD